MPIFNEDEQQRIRRAIEQAEKNTSGEIRVCVEKKCPNNPLDRAAVCFKKLDMHTTHDRNGVLIYIATTDKQFAIIGDVGINQAVPDDFWDLTKEDMLSLFKQGDLVGGIVAGVLEAGQQLKTYFPYREKDKNELSDDIAFMDGE
ncbi:TPM domain-containing protein [Mucilaginibacter robiniae]|uniref:TPM domain-containing protein n=1 Tax=Mucilaginibacter robiniae TaxID=2728022 RepID=A0A7L5DV68_9SPHI|nr:TPM domain-containing protein [Mucilaginibacter robiniae]QJD95005.1 TPM domain-containing protein [Mucilaginibacter robiniae]